MTQGLAATIEEYGGPPVVRQRPLATLDGMHRIRVRVHAVALNPVDHLITSGRWYGGNPSLPYVPGREGVGTVLEASTLPAGQLVYFRIQGIEQGCLSQEACPSAVNVIPLPADTDAVLAAATGFAGTTAALALKIRGGMTEGERVAVLGATGSVGRMAAALAVHFGAASVVAVGRSPKAWDTNTADPAVSYVAIEEQVRDSQTGEEQATRLSEAIIQAGGGRPDLVIDPVWGMPASAALKALAPHGRLVNLGSSAGGTVDVPSELLRSTCADIRGHSTAKASPDLYAEYFRQVLALARTGRVALPTEVFPISQAKEAWFRVGRSPRVKVVVDVRRGTE